MKNLKVLYAILLLLIIVIGLLLFNCFNCKKITIKPVDPTSTLNSPCIKPTPITIPAGTPLIIQLNAGGNIDETKFDLIKKCDCEANLSLVSLKEDYQTEGTGGQLASKPPMGGQGGDVSLNFAMDSTQELDVKIDTNKIITLSKIAGNNQIKIAVLDTGLDPRYVNNSNILDDSICTIPSFRNDLDNHSSKHGTVVTQLLLKQFEGGNYFPKILPIKVLNKNKAGDLFDFVCGLYKAKKANVNAIVASMGYYGEKSIILTNALKMLNNEGIKLFAATGNASQTYDAVEIQNGRDSRNVRNLGTRLNSFYPAYYANEPEYQNLFSVTTAIISSNIYKYCPNQNYYEGIKLFSVLGDDSCGIPYGNGMISGSSYANPIFAGQFLKNNGSLNLNNSNIPNVLVYRDSDDD